MAVATFHEFDTREQLAMTLAETIRRKAHDAIESPNGRRRDASLAFSGGSTPKLLIEELARIWDCGEDTDYTLIDDRYLPEGHERRNTHFLEALIASDRDGAPDVEEGFALATRYDLVHDSDDPVRNMRLANEEMDGMELPLTVAILGMGTDGHTASWFPDSPELSHAVCSATRDNVVHVRSESAGEDRVTLTMPVIALARNVYLHIEGAEKRKAYETALEDGPADDMPIRHILRHPDIQLEVFWAP